MKYKELKAISAENAMACTPDQHDFAVFIDTFGYGSVSAETFVILQHFEFSVPRLYLRLRPPKKIPLDTHLVCQNFQLLSLRISYSRFQYI